MRGGDAANWASRMRRKRVVQGLDAALPLTLPGELLVHVDAATPGKMYTTAGGSTASTAGTAVARWETVGASLASLNTTDSGVSGFTARSEGGLLVGECLGGSLALSAVCSKTWTTQTVYCLLRLTSISGGNSFFTMGASQAIPWMGVRNSVATQMRCQTWDDTNVMGVSPLMSTSQWHVIAFTYDGPGDKTRVFVDGAERSTVLGGQGAAASIAGALLSLGRGASSNFCNARFAAFAVYDATHTAAQVRAMTDYWFARYPTLLDTSSPCLIFTGSSHQMDNSPGTDGAGLAAVNLANASALTTLGWNFALSGTTTPQQTARVSDEMAHILRRRTGQVVVCHHNGGNDISAGGMTAAQVYSNLKLHVEAVKAVLPSAKVVVGTYLPQTGVNNTTRNDANALILADADGAFDGVADMASDDDMGDDGDNANTTYYQADGTHFKAAGATRAASYWTTPVANAFA